MKKVDKIILGISLVAIVITMIVGYSYAYWVTSYASHDKNIIASGCFDISVTGRNSIGLDSSYPMQDTDGMKLTPYTFTIKNTCSVGESYAINLEALASTTFNLDNIKVAIDDEINTYSSLTFAIKNFNDSKSSKKIAEGSLEPDEMVAYDLRLWVNSSAGMEVQSQNLEAKIIVTATPTEVSKDKLKSTNKDDDTAFRSSTYKSKIKTITFQITINIPTEAVEVWDIGVEENTVKAFVLPNVTSGYYDLYIQSNNQLYANRNMSYWFYDFKNVDAINGLELLNMSNVTDTSYMFYKTGYSSTTFQLDLGDKFDTRNVIKMNQMFNQTGYSSTAFTLNLGRYFDTTKNTRMDYMFSSTGFKSTVFTLDLGNRFDTSSAINMSNMFLQTGYRSPVFALNLGDKFDTSNVTNMTKMFTGVGYSSLVFTLDLGDKFDTSNVTNMHDMFLSAGQSSTNFILRLGDKFDTSNVTDMGYMFKYVGSDDPNFMLSLGNKFDTSNVTDMTEMFYNTGHLSHSLNIIIDFTGTSYQTYTSIFEETAMREGSKITVNYTAENETLVDAMIATKTEDANVVKGSLLTKHSITIDDANISSDVSEEYKTKRVTLTASNGKEIKSFSVNGVRVEGNHFNMLNQDVRITNVELAS